MRRLYGENWVGYGNLEVERSQRGVESTEWSELGVWRIGNGTENWKWSGVNCECGGGLGAVCQRCGVNRGVEEWGRDVELGVERSQLDGVNWEWSRVDSDWDGVNCIE